MSRNNISAKKRLLYLQDLLKKYTDEETELTLSQITEKFYQVYNVEVGKKAIRDDLDELEKSHLMDITINQEKNGDKKYYSHQYRLFELQESRLLIDAVSAAKFITQKQSDTIVNKIKELMSNKFGSSAGKQTPVTCWSKK